MSLHGKDIKIFACSASVELARSIAGTLELPLGKSRMTTFSDGEINCAIGESVRGSEVFVVQSTCAPVNDNLMELLIMIDAFRRASAGNITAVIPYYGYARQDRKVNSRDPISAKLVANLITTAGANRLLTMDLHSPQIQGFFDIPLDHLSGRAALVPYFKPLAEKLGDRLICVSPDLGAVTRTRSFSNRLGCAMAIIDKRRPRPNECEITGIIGEVRGKSVILADDMIDTAGTLCKAAQALIDNGAAEVYACASHGVLSGPAVQRIESSPIKELVILDTVPLRTQKRLDKITVLGTHKIFADAIERIYSDAPITELLD